MREFIRKYLYIWRYYSLNKTAYTKCMEKFNTTNLNSLRRANYIAVIMASAFSLFPFFIEDEIPKAFVYLAVAFIALILNFIEKLVVRPNRQADTSLPTPNIRSIYTLIVFYFVNIMFLGIYLGVWSAPERGVMTFLGLLIATLSFFVVSPVFYLCLTSAAVIVCSAASIMSKEPAFWFYDIINILIAYIISLLLGWTVIMYRLSAMLNIGDMESEMTEKNEQINMILEKAPIGITLFDDKYQCVNCNESALRIFNLSKEDYITFFNSGAHSPEYQPDGQNSLEKASAIIEQVLNGEDKKYEWMHSLPNGDPLPVELFMSRLKQGDRYIGIGYFYDMREQHRIRNIVQRRSAMFESLSSMANTFLSLKSDYFIDVLGAALKPVVDATGITRVSIFWFLDDVKRFGQIYLWQGGRMAPLDPELLVLPDLPFYERWTDIMQQGKYLHRRIGEMLEDEAAFLSLFRTKVILLVPVSIKDEYQGAISFESSTEDAYYDEDTVDILCTAAMLCAGAVVRNMIEKDQGRLKEDIEAALIKAEEASHAKSEFLSRMSHEMRTPMNAIVGMSQVAKVSSDSEKRSECFKEIDAAVNELLRLIDNLLDVSGIDYGTLQLADLGFDFHAMMRDILQMAIHNSAEKEQRFSYYIDSMIPAFLVGDEGRLKQVIINLLHNAIKFTSIKGKIHLSINMLEHTAENIVLIFEVSDNGIGISKEKQEGIFDLFYQADGSLTREHSGIGIGLALSRRIALMMGGDLSLTSEQGKGSKFTFTCKLRVQYRILNGDFKWNSSESSAANEITDLSLHELDDGPLPDFSGKCILVTEDMATNRKVVRDILAETGVQIIEAVNGKEAVRLFKEAPEEIDLILMDIMMPIMNGLDAARAIRSSGLPKSNIPIIALTALTKKDDIEKAKSVGMDSHIGKPTEAKMLILTLKQFLCS